MPPIGDAAYLETLIRAYFADPAYCIVLQQGEVLMQHGEANDRLYLLLRGRLMAKIPGLMGKVYNLFPITAQRFVGIYSFFSETYRSLMTLVAEEESELAYMDAARFEALSQNDARIFERFMPVVVLELVHRLQQTQALTMERERTFEKLLQSEKLASLGQMAAGIAHELNNAIAVLERNSAYLCEALSGTFETPVLNALYEKGVAEGQVHSSRALRVRSREFQKQLGLDAETAWLAAEAWLEVDDVRRIKQPSQEVVQQHKAWKTGAALHNMLVASRQAAHVVRSVRTLGMPHAQREANVDVNETLRDALALLQSPLRQVQVACDFDALPGIVANKGELVQVWTNLIKNACESMAQAQTSPAELRISSAVAEGRIRVGVQDNGPGIPADILPRIFQPNVTTKVDGLAFGLGLGLTIVLQLVQGYGGSVAVESRPGCTAFFVNLPLEGNS